MENYSILIIDDSPDNLETIIEYLSESELSLTILKAPNGKIACSLAEKKHPDLIITDWEMPEMDGIETIKYLKSQEKTKDIPIIMCTGKMITSENLNMSLKAGAVDYIRKPIDIIELNARVNSMLKLSRSYKKIKHLIATKDKFFSIIAHDLKTPFTGLLGLTEIMYNQYDEFDRDEFKKYIKLIYENSKSTFNLLQNLLSWSMSQKSNISYNPESFSINKTILENITLLENAANEKNIKIENFCIKEFTVFADKNMILTVLRNLISNAIKFTTKKGKITIACKQIDEKAIQISITDTGIGIAKENIPKLFNIEQNFNTMGTADEKGTGLGLIVCKEFIEQHGSKIEVESETGKGSTFYFTLPLMQRDN